MTDIQSFSDTPDRPEPLDGEDLALSAPTLDAQEIAIEGAVYSRRGAAVSVRPLDALFYALLVAILAVGAWLRFDGQNWDDYTHLHPDERFLTDVVSLLNGPLQFTDPTPEAAEQHRLRCEARYPAPTVEGDDPAARLSALEQAGRGGYFDAECSPLNPNNLGKGLYVYGEFPLFTVHLAGVARSHLSQDWHSFLTTFDPEAAAEHRITTHWETYTGAQLVGRSVAAAADWLTIIVLFLLGRRLYGRWTGLLAAGFYAVAAFPLQQSHFWTVDTFTTLWVTLALYFAVRALDGASALRGAPAAAYLALWAGAVIWEVAYWERPALGAALLGGVFLLALPVMAGLSQIAPPHLRRAVVAASGLIAALVYVVTALALDVFASRPFPLGEDLIALGFDAVFYGLAALILALIADVLRGPRRSAERFSRPAWVVGALGVLWLALVGALLLDALAPWAALLVALGGVALLIVDVTDLADYALFGVALGAAVASRINVAPLAGIIALAAAIRLLPLLDRALDRAQRSHILAHTLSGVMAAAVVALVVFRLLQPHAFLGPDIWGLRFNPGWLDDAREAATLTSGQWDAPPNHQWASRTPYLFPWRNIVLWGFGLPLGLVAWGAWAWAGSGIARARPQWTRHLIPFAWVLVIFAWLGGRWVTTMRYFLPIYPPLALFAAWALVRLVAAAWRAYRADPRAARRLALGGAVALLVFVYGYTALFGFGVHNIHRRQLTRVAASRWFQEFVPGDFGVWIEGDGQRQMVNLGRGQVSAPPSVLRLEQGESAEVGFNVPGEARVFALTFHHLLDPAEDAGPETLRARLWRNDPFLGRQLEWEGTLERDFSNAASPYGTSYRLDVGGEVTLAPLETGDPLRQPFTLEISALDGGPISLVGGVAESVTSPLSMVTLGVQSTFDDTVSGLDLSFAAPPLITGHGDDIPAVPTHWTPGGGDAIQFLIPIDGVIETVEIPHLGDPLMDAGVETVHFTLIGPDGETRTATVSEDLSAGADPLGVPQTLTFDPPLPVQKYDPAGAPQLATLVIEAEDPVYTSGPVIAWEGDWDDPVPWPVCPLPDDVPYRDDLPSGLSSYDCASIGMYGAHYQGLKLWLVAEDTDQKRAAMLNALDQADYLVITSNRFYDSLSRISMRWPMTMAFYDALFDGRLGFELVKTFESYPSVGPVTIPDQALPTDDLPAWVNEHWEAEEAYHVYDHPAVLVFRKNGGYAPENTAAILDSVSRRPVTAAIPGYMPDPEPVGLFVWNAVQASQAPTLLQFTAEQWDVQRAGGTWRALFDLDALINRNQVVAVIAWWLLITGAGWLAWPLLFAAFPALPDRAFPVARITAWLLVAWIAWVGGSLGLRTWTRPGLAAITLGLAALALAAAWTRRGALWLYLRANWRHLLLIEALALALFLAFVGVRLGNPDLWQPGLGGEKPMDLAYFNGVLRSTIFPPIDPWFSGGYINYYYFGYVIVGAPVKLIGLDPAIAYNLILPALYAMTGLGVFSIAYNWVRARAVRPGEIACATRDRSLMAGASLPFEAQPGAPPGLRREPPAPRGSAWLAGTLALALAIILGNLGTVLVFVREVAALDGWQPVPMLTHVRRAELESERSAIYERLYGEAVEDFRDENGGRSPSELEMSVLAADAQVRAEEWITDKAQHPPLIRIWEHGLTGLRAQLQAFFNGLGRVLDGQPLAIYSNRWHWGPTRIISELAPAGAGHNAINEMPYFTFLYGDLHAHMISMPVYLLALLWLVAEIAGAGWALRRGWEAALALFIGGLAVGILRPTNTWDWITFLILGVAGLTYAAWLGAARTTGHLPVPEAATRLWALLRPGRARSLWPVLLLLPLGAAARIAYYVVRRMQADDQLKRGLRIGETLIDPGVTPGSVALWMIGALAVGVVVYVGLLIALRARIDRPRLLDWLGRVALFLVIVFAVALPFASTFATPYSSIKPWEAETTPLWAYLYIHGLFIFIVISFLVWQTARWLRRVRVRDLAGLAVPVIGVGAALLLVVLFSIVYGVREVPVAQLVVPLIAWATALFFLPRQAPLLRAVYALIVLALAISLGVELVVLDGDIGRQNTVFKFYLQVWFLLSIAGGIALAWMLRVTHRWALPLRAAWSGALALLMAIALLYPVMATRARFEDRFNKAETPLTLDGMAYMKVARHYQGNAAFSLAGDYEMIRWLQENVEGTPVIVEGRYYPTEYSWTGRISINTGLPTILGWRWHQTQQRGLDNLPLLVQTRENNVAALYTLPEPVLGSIDPATGLPQAISEPPQDAAMAEAIRAAWNLLRHYEVEYLIAGTLEHAIYNDFAADPETGMMTAGHAPGLAKFERMAGMGLLEIVYEAPRCIDYATAPGEDCPPESVYFDRIYRVVPGATLPDTLAAR